MALLLECELLLSFPQILHACNILESTPIRRQRSKIVKSEDLRSLAIGISLAIGSNMDFRVFVTVVTVCDSVTVVTVELVNDPIDGKKRNAINDHIN